MDIEFQNEEMEIAMAIEEKKDLLELVNHLHRLLHHRALHHHQHLGPMGDPYRGQGRILALLKMKPEISQKDLLYLTDMRPQSLGELLAKLENNGYIVRRQAENDKRAMIVQLTDKGRDETIPGEKGFDHNAVFDCLDEEEKASLAAYLERLIVSLKEQLGDEAECEPLPPHLRGELPPHLRGELPPHERCCHGSLPHPGEHIPPHERCGHGPRHHHGHHGPEPLPHGRRGCQGRLGAEEPMDGEDQGE